MVGLGVNDMLSLKTKIAESEPGVATQKFIY